MSDDSAATFIKRLRSMGHMSPFEHVSFTFAVSGVSRSLLAQITRHRIASFSVQSQRYVDMNNPEFVIPDAIQNNPHALKVFNDLTDHAARAYRDIRALLIGERLYEKYANELNHDGLNSVFSENPKYFDLALSSAMEGMEKDSPEAAQKYAEFKKDKNAAEKFANENARAVLPNASTTQLVVTMNARELMHFFNQRCCYRAQDEIRLLADSMLMLCKMSAPNIFADAGAPCVSGPCPEGKMSCGHPRRDDM